jgi:hypothetical protein
MLISVQVINEKGMSTNTSISNISTVGAASRRFIVNSRSNSTYTP